MKMHGTPPPSEILREYLLVHPEHESKFKHILKGEWITEQEAQELADAFNTSAEFWLNLSRQYYESKGISTVEEYRTGMRQTRGYMDMIKGSEEHKRASELLDSAAFFEYHYKPITNDEEHEAALKQAKELIRKNAEPYSDDDIDLSLLYARIHRYEVKHWPIPEPELEYKGYKGTVELHEGNYSGCIVGITPTVNYNGTNFEELVEAFEFAVDDYLNDLGNTP